MKTKLSVDLEPVTTATLRRVAGTFATGVTVVTTITEERPQGCAANAVASLSLDPPLMLVCLNRESNTHDHLSRSRIFAINILDDSAKSRTLCRSFAQQSGGKFQNVKFRSGLIGVPILTQAMSWLECELVDAHPSGDHTIFIGKVVAAEETRRMPLISFRGRFGELSVNPPVTATPTDSPLLMNWSMTTWAPLG